MLKIEALDKADLDLHLTWVTEKFNDEYSSIDYAPLRKDAKDLIEYLNERLSDVAIGQPSVLEKVIGHVGQNHTFLVEYMKNPPGKNSGRRKCKKTEATIAQINRLFSYDKFIAKTKGWNAYAFVSKHNLRVCPYCHLHHVNFHLKSGENKFEMRPPLDHFFPKQRYPYLAVSAFNLVPSCTTCNSSVKLARDPRDSAQFPHPMDCEANVSISFRPSAPLLPGIDEGIDEVSVTLAANDPGSELWMNFFQLPVRYSWYQPEVADLYRRYKNYCEWDEDHKEALPRRRYLLGFDEQHVLRRTLGICLFQIESQLK